MTREVSGAAAEDRVGRRSGAMVAERQRAKPAARSGVMADEDGDSDKFEEEEWDDGSAKRSGARASGGEVGDGGRATASRVGGGAGDGGRR